MLVRGVCQNEVNDWPVQKFGVAEASLTHPEQVGIMTPRRWGRSRANSVGEQAGATLPPCALFFLVGGFLVGGGFRLAVSFLGKLVRLGGVLHGLPRKFVGGFMVLFVVMHGSGTVRVGSHFVEFRGSLVRIFGHKWAPRSAGAARALSIRLNGFPRRPLGDLRQLADAC
jgi:hypothetical protein